MRRGSRSGFSSIDAAADGVLRRMSSGESALVWIRARWPRIVGEPLSRKIVPAELAGRRLTLSLLDPAWRKPIEAALPELERRLAVELPGVRPRVHLRETGDGRRETRREQGL
jgi:Dna[CI] antecedent, DciA